MNILFYVGFTEDEICTYRRILLQNAMIGMQELVKQAEKLEYTITEDNRKRGRFFREMNPYETDWSADIGSKLKELWQDPAIRQAWAVAPEYQLQMSMLDYHVANLDRYTEEGFQPTDADMLRARQRTTGTQQTMFEIGKYAWTIVDVGGQKPERAKWEAVLDEGLNAVIFFVALDEYNMASVEEQGRTKMQIAIETFEEMASNPKTKDLTVLLFLNKIDLFRKKINTQRDFEAFQKVFPSFPDVQKPEVAANFLVNLFSTKFCKASGRPRDDFRVHITCALDTDAMDQVFKAVKESLFVTRMNLSGVDMM